MTAWIDRMLLQRIRTEVVSWKPGGALSELVILGTRPAKLDQHMRHLLQHGELRGVMVRAAGRRMVLAKGLTPKGLTAMMERAADEAEQGNRLPGRLKKLGARGLQKLAASAWQAAAAVVIAAVLGILGLSG